MSDFDSKPIGIGNLTNLKRKTRKFGSSADPELKKVPAEPAATGDDDVAQLAVDVIETNDQLFIIAPLAGVAPEEVRVEITDDVVVIEGEREYPLGKIEKDDLLVQECYFGSFSRSIVLPESVDSKRAKAEFQKNVLVISLPKLDNVRTRIIKVESK
jgi:HSP20 family protein